MHFYVALERCCHVQLMADAAAAGTGGKTIIIGQEEAAYTHSVVGTMHAGYFNGLTHFQVLEAQEGVSYDFAGTLQPSQGVGK